jgi:hypothetical protein
VDSYRPACEPATKWCSSGIDEAAERWHGIYSQVKFQAGSFDWTGQASAAAYERTAADFAIVQKSLEVSPLRGGFGSSSVAARRFNAFPTCDWVIPNAPRSDVANLPSW